MAKNPRLIDLTSKRFGRWTVVRQDGNTLGGAATWLCKCDCGTERAVLGQDLRKGKSVSCGCLKNEKTGDRHRVHGGTGSRLYSVWKNMRKRCNNPNATGYDLYGGRGVSVCPEWDDFNTFSEWANFNGYNDNLTIERLDVNGNYCPENCTWIEADKQSANRRIVRRAPDGELWWHKARKNGITRAAFTWRISQGWPMELVVSHAPGKRRIKRERDTRGRFC